MGGKISKPVFESHTGNNVAELLGNWEWDLERPSNNTAVITDNTMRNTDTALSEILISNSEPMETGQCL